MADNSGMEIASLRSLDDFLLESARFQIPNFKDLEKWNNRVYQNLLYYQTNYFLTYFIGFLLIGKMFCGILAVVATGGVFYALTSTQRPAFDFRKEHPIIFLLLKISVAYLFVYLLDSVAVFLFGILLPLVAIFVHASMRQRNLRNKVLNKMEWAGLRQTLMGKMLEAIGWETDITM